MKKPMEIYISKRRPEMLANIIQHGLDNDRTVVIFPKTNQAVTSVGESLALINKKCEFVKEDDTLKMIVKP